MATRFPPVVLLGAIVLLAIASPVAYAASTPFEPAEGAPGNLLVNPGAEMGASAWQTSSFSATPYGTAPQPSASFAQERNFGAQAFTTSSPTATLTQTIDASTLAGRTAYLGGWFGQFTSRPERGRLSVQWLASDGTVLQTDTTLPDRGSDVESDAGVDMARYVKTIRGVPADTRQARVTAFVEGARSSTPYVMAEQLYLSDQWNPVPLAPGPATTPAQNPATPGSVVSGAPTGSPSADTLSVRKLALQSRPGRRLAVIVDATSTDPFNVVLQKRGSTRYVSVRKLRLAARLGRVTITVTRYGKHRISSGRYRVLLLASGHPARVSASVRVR